MNRFNLNFSDSSLESAYRKSNKPFVIKTLYFCFQLEMTYSLIMLGIIAIKSGFAILVISAILAIAGLLLLFAILKKYLLQKNLFEGFLIVFCNTVSIFCSESIKGLQNSEGHVEISSVFVGMTIQFFLNITFLTRLPWYYSSMGYVFNVTYMLGRLMKADSTHLATTLIGVLILVIIFPLISYQHEKNYREYYKILHDSNDNLKKFKEVIQSVLPSPIFILNNQGDSVEFMNASACKLINKGRSGMVGDCDFLLEPSSSTFHSQDKKIIMEKIQEVLKNFKIIKSNNEDSLILDIDKTTILEVIKNFPVCTKQKNSKFIADLRDDFLTFHVIRDEKKTMIDDQIDQPERLLKRSYYEVRMTTLNWDNKPAIIIIFNNQTKAKRVTELMNLDKYKNQMLATISHDLRTPLNGIIGMISTAMNNIFDRENKKNLKIALSSAHLLSYLINDILDFSQMAYKKLRINCEKIDILDMVKEIFKMMKFQANKKKIFLKKEIQMNNKSLYFSSDPMRIKQILLNLLGNALKFTKAGGSVTLKVENISTQELENVIKFSVIDTGIGIKEEDKGKLFVLFGKLQNEDPEMNKTGIGFGLTISQNLARMLYSGPNCGINVESEVGKGSTFSFKVSQQQNLFQKEEISCNVINEEKNLLLPYDSNTHKSMKDKYSEKNEKSPRTLKNQINVSQRALIVDDDPVNVMILEKYMQYYKIDYISAANGLEAVTIIENEVIMDKKEFSFILMDCNMPIMNGFRASEKINELLQKNHLKEIPIIAVTANVTNADKELCFQSGMKAFVTKPVSRDDLGLLIKSYQ